MATLLALYSTPADARKFDEYYFGTHLPLAKRLPGLVSYEVSTGVKTLGGNAYYIVAKLDFRSMADAQAALVSPEGGSTAGDLANFAQAGVTLLLFGSKDGLERGRELLVPTCINQRIWHGDVSKIPLAWSTRMDGHRDYG